MAETAALLSVVDPRLVAPIVPNRQCPIAVHSLLHLVAPIVPNRPAPKVSTNDLHQNQPEICYNLAVASQVVFVPILTEAMDAFARNIRFILRTRDYLATWESRLTARQLKVIRRMFKDGEDGVARGLSAPSAV